MPFAFTLCRACGKPVYVGAVHCANCRYRPSADDKMLEGMMDQMNKTTAQASAAIDKALAFVEASNKRIAAMERQAAQWVSLKKCGTRSPR